MHKIRILDYILDPCALASTKAKKELTWQRKCNIRYRTDMKINEI